MDGFKVTCFFKHSKTKYIFFALISAISTNAPLKSGWFFGKSAYRPFRQIETYSEVQKIFDACDKNTLITFDVDDTLITAVDVMANFDFPLWFGIRAIFKYPGLVLSKSSIEPALSILFQQAERFVFDPDIIQIIQQIRKQGSTTVGLTGMWSGPYGVIESMPAWRTTMLSQLDISFDGQLTDTFLTTLPKYRDQHPCLYKGILFANRTDKGKVLGAFLDHFHLTPAQIISFDDQETDLDSIASLCIERNITFAGYQVLGGKKLCREWNNDRALLQLDYLMRDSLWLNDKEADAILAGEVRA